MPNLQKAHISLPRKSEIGFNKILYRRQTLCVRLARAPTIAVWNARRRGWLLDNDDDYDDDDDNDDDCDADSYCSIECQKERLVTFFGGHDQDYVDYKCHHRDKLKMKIMMRIMLITNVFTNRSKR